MESLLCLHLQWIPIAYRTKSKWQSHGSLSSHISYQPPFSEFMPQPCWRTYNILFILRILYRVVPLPETFFLPSIFAWEGPGKLLLTLLISTITSFKKSLWVSHSLPPQLDLVKFTLLFTPTNTYFLYQMTYFLCCNYLFLYQSLWLNYTLLKDWEVVSFTIVSQNLTD